MGNEYTTKILKMIDEINEITDIDEKKEAIYLLTSYCTYLYYCGYITENQYMYSLLRLDEDPEELAYVSERDNTIKELVNNNKLLNNYYKDALKIYNDNFIPKKTDYQHSIRMNEFFQDFLAYMNCDKLYDSLLLKKNISFNSIIDHSVCVNARENSYIVINEKKSFNRYFVMSHEIAHAYENYVMKDIKSYFDISYNTEIFSILFNRIFMEFIIENKILDIEEERIMVNNFEANYYNFLMQALFITEIIYSKNYSFFDYDILLKSKKYAINCSLTDHNYALGSLISLQLLNDWRNNDTLFIKELPELIKYIRSLNLDELVNNFNNKEIVTSELKRLIKSK